MTWTGPSVFRFKKGPQSAQDLHILNVYEDPDFAKEILHLFPAREAYLTLWKQEIKTPKQDSEYKELVKTVDALSNSDISEMANKYRVTPSDIKWYLRGLNVNLGFHREQKKPFQLLNVTDNEFIISFNIDITKEDFVEAYQIAVKAVRSSSTKNKLPSYHKLVYAVFKARQKKMTFKQIYDLYSVGKLPSYENGAKPFNSQEKLKDYFYKYRPNTTSNSSN